MATGPVGKLLCAAGAAFALCLAATCTVRAEPPTAGASRPAGPVALVAADQDAAGKLQTARMLIEQDQRDQAIRALQSLLLGSPDKLVAAEKDRRYVSVQVAANGLIHSLGADGLKRYRQLYDADAGKLYERWSAEKDAAALRKLLSAYPHTTYGVRAFAAVAASAPATAPAAEGNWRGMGAVGSGIAVMDDCDVMLTPQWRQPEGDPVDRDLAGSLIALRDEMECPSARLGWYTRLRNGHVYARLGGPLDRGGIAEVLLPSAVHPVVVGNEVIIRTHEGVVAYDAITGEMVWQTFGLPLVKQNWGQTRMA